MMVRSGKSMPLVLLADPGLERATALHNACVKSGVTTIVARDLPTALLMLSQHVFDGAIISSRIMEESDGFSLAAVFRMIFPEAYIGVIAKEKSVLTLQSAINNGVDQIFESTAKPEQMVAAMVGVLPQMRVEKAARVSVQ
jgi:PleD family two-component response regulator